MTYSERSGLDFQEPPRLHEELLEKATGPIKEGFIDKALGISPGIPENLDD